MKNEKNLTFEKAMEGLERSAEALKRGETTLQEAIDQFEEGMKYYNLCIDILEKAKQKVMLYDKDAGLEREFD